MKIEEVKDIAKNIDKEKVVSMFQLLKEKKYFAFGKAFAVMIWGLYGKYLKGKSVTIKGKKIPLTAIIIALFAGYIMLPSSEEKTEPVAEQLPELTVADENSYDKDGLKIYGFEKCEQAICGILENNSDKTLGRVVISVTFNDRQKNVLAEGAIDAKDVAPGFKAKLNIPSDVDFYSFTLTDVTVE